MEFFDVAGYQMRGLIKGLGAVGIDPWPLLDEAQVDRASIDDPEVRFPEHQILLIWLAAERRWTAPESLGLCVGANIPWGALELIDYLIAASPTLGEGLATLVRYADLCASGFQYRIEPVETDLGPTMALRLNHRSGLELVPPGMLDYLWSAMITRIRTWAVPGFQPRLHTRGAPVGPRETYRRMLGDVRFGAAQEVLHVPLAQWNLPNGRCDPGLSSLLTRHAHDVLARLPERGDFLATVRATIADCLRLGDVRIEHAAKRLALTPRTLQRRLTDEGQVYRQLVEDVRCVAARTYLARTDLSLQEVSDLLAYSEQRAFQRAFLRWTAQSPQAYRRAQREAQRAELGANQRVAIRART